MEDSVLIVIYATLFSITSIFMLIYFRRMRQAADEYRRAKNVIDDVIVSFNRDLQRQNEKIQEIARSYEQMASKEDNKINEINAMILEIKSKLEELMGHRERLSTDYEDLKVKVDDMRAKYDEILRRISEVERNLSERVRTKEREETSHLAPKVRESRALARLTETELRVLEILAAEGEKTVPEIRDRIGLTREHTARLMKSLYTRGYVERVSDRVPYVYRLNREMEEILRREGVKS